MFFFFFVLFSFWLKFLLSVNELFVETFIEETKLTPIRQ